MRFGGRVLIALVIALLLGSLGPALCRADELGLTLPEKVDASRPLNVLVAGLYSGKQHWSDIDDCLTKDGQQIAQFVYSSDVSLADSAALLTRQIQELHKIHPKLRLNLITHSMGGLVARAYVEGKEYMGDVDHLFLIATPNKGTAWARLAFVMEYNATGKVSTMPNPLKEKRDCAATDLLPGSKFLADLDKLKRREGVKYTIIAGCRNEGLQRAAGAIDSAVAKIPQNISSRWGLRQICGAMDGLTEKLRDHQSGSDGVVSVESAQLEGVKDSVTLAASHNGLVWKNGKEPAPAWAVIKDRLGK